MNNKFLNEAKEIEKKWHKSGLLQDKFERVTTANLLECQRLINEVITPEDIDKLNKTSEAPKIQKFYVCLYKNGRFVDRVETKCTRPEQIEDINKLLKDYSLFGIENDLKLEEEYE